MYTSSVKSKEEEASSTEEDWEADEKEESVEEKKEVKAKSPKVSDREVTIVPLCMKQSRKRQPSVKSPLLTFRQILEALGVEWRNLIPRFASTKEPRN